MKHSSRSFITSLIILFISIGFCSANENNQPLLIKADHLEYHENLDEVQAHGNVEISQENRLLRADRVTYNRKTDLMTASGHVWMKEETGEIIFADYVEFSKKASDGFIREAKVILTDNSRLSARTGKKIGKTKLILRQGVYSPCNLCKDTPGKVCKDYTDCAPLWQIKAEKVIQDKEDQIVIYHNAHMELFGFPVLYTPYFRHPDPSVKRKSGILMPTYGTDSDLGKIFSLPIYYVISSNQDIILTPIFTSKQGPIIASQYRHRFENGDLTASGSYTRSHLKKPKGVIIKDTPTAKYPHEDRWHVSTQGRFDLDEEHLLTFDITRASDTTYLQRYPVLYTRSKLLLYSKNLTSTAALEQFKDKSYASMRGYSFQTDAPETTPFVFPLAVYAYQTDPYPNGSVLNFDSNLMVTQRDRGEAGKNAEIMRRLSVGTEWRLPYVTRWGDAWTLRLGIRTDGYSVHQFKRLKDPHPRSFSHIRVFPQASVDWRYPFINRFNSWSWVVEPLAMVVGSTRDKDNSRFLPNEDSLITLLDDSTLFIPNRFSGIDRIDSGRRAVYGLKNGFYFSEQRQITLFAGQSRRLDNKRVLPLKSGEDHIASDYLTRVQIKPAPWLSLTNRSALARNTFRTRVSETALTLGNNTLLGTIGHVYLAPDATMSGKPSSQAVLQISSNPTNFLTLSFSETRNLKSNRPRNAAGKKVKAVLSDNLSITYHDECFKLITSFFRTNYQDRDLKPNKGALVQLVFKTLGTFSFDPLSAFDSSDKKSTSRIF